MQKKLMELKDKALKFAKKHKAQLVMAAMFTLLVVATGAAPAHAANGQAAAVPSLDLDIEAGLQIIFDYTAYLFPSLMQIGGIGIGFGFAAALVVWIGSMLKGALRFGG